MDFTTARGVLHIVMPGGDDEAEPIEALHMLESIGDGFPKTYKYDKVHAKISALKFRYAVLESRGEMIPIDTLEADLQALADIAEYCINNG